MSTTQNHTDTQNHWLYWEAGLLASVAALITTPCESPEYLFLGLVTMLFFWGFIKD